MPKDYPPKSTCHDRFQEYNQSGCLFDILRELYYMLSDQGKINMDLAFIDGTFSPAKKGVSMLDSLKKERALKK